MLAEISLETELRIQEITILLLRIQELSKRGSVPSGLKIEPSMKQTLFFTERAMTMALLQKSNYRQRAVEKQVQARGYLSDEEKMD